ncbi:hypothetical protein SteCoe_38104 [Stentor coeruleus]|uniref:Uncharacterized protein n=1 Tax=Stentor coeruleus TaxID=5963 RepID=A0A1R2ALU2_9CILI|nr:hypothetical protein SteCoe_38104 [Stentor coeruleus]
MSVSNIQSVPGMNHEPNQEVKSFVLIKMFTDNSDLSDLSDQSNQSNQFNQSGQFESYSKFKSMIDDNTISFLRENLINSFTLIGIYGDEHNCKKKIKEYFNLMPLNLPNIDEGIILFYSFKNTKALLWQKCNYDEFIRNKSDSPKCSFLYGIRLLSDLCPFVIGFMSNEEEKDWTNESLYKNVKTSAIPAEQSMEIREIDKCENLNEILLQSNIRKLPLTKDSFDNMIFAKVSKINYDSEDKAIVKFFDEFLASVNGENFDNINFSGSFQLFLQKIQGYIGNWSGSFEAAQKEINDLFKEHKAKKKKILDDHLKSIRERLKTFLNSNRKKAVYTKIEPVEKILKNLTKYLQDMKDINLYDSFFKKFLLTYEIKEKLVPGFIKSIKTEIQDLKNSFKDEKTKFRIISGDILSKLEKIINMFVLEIDYSRLQFSKSNNIQAFQINLDTTIMLTRIELESTDYDLKQVINLSNNIFCVLIKNCVNNVTKCFKVEEENLEYKSTNLVDLPDNDAFLAWGSTKDIFFLVMNNMEKVMIGNYLDDLGNNGLNEVQVFSSKITYIKALCYLSKSNRLLILSDYKYLWFFYPNRQSASKITERIIRDKFGYGDKEIIDPSLTHSYLDLKVTSDENNYITLSEKYIEVFNMESFRLHYIPIDQEIMSNYWI